MLSNKDDRSIALIQKFLTAKVRTIAFETELLSYPGNQIIKTQTKQCYVLS